MRRFILVPALFALFVSRPVGAQATDYVPSHRLPEGRELVAVYAFDRVVIGGNWTNVGVEQFVLRDSLAELVMPQVVLMERTVQLGQRVTVSEPRVLRRITGGADIPAWFAAGAPIPVLEDRKPR